jgi:hypothetical protein
MSHATRLHVEVPRPLRGAGLVVGLLAASVPCALTARAAESGSARLKVEFGHASEGLASRQVRFLSDSPEVEIALPSGVSVESNDVVSEESVLNCGGGDVDGLVVEVSWPATEPAPSRAIAPGTHMWRYLLENGSPGQVRRLKDDAWFRPDSPVVTVQLDPAGTRGFSIDLGQLRDHGAMWLPEHDAFVSLASRPTSWTHHRATLAGSRTLDRVRSQPEATLESFRNVWTDVGDPRVSDPSWGDWQTEWMGTRGHLTVAAASHGSVYKFAIDRWGSIRPDFASPHTFALDLEWPGAEWREQTIDNGLPILETRLSKAGRSCQIEQFAASLYPVAAAIEGYVPSVLLSRIRFSGTREPFAFHVRFARPLDDSLPRLERTPGAWRITDPATGRILLMLRRDGGRPIRVEASPPAEDAGALALAVSGEVDDDATAELHVLLPSPGVAPTQTPRLADLDLDSAREQTVAYWEEWLDRGARFEVPEVSVNHLFRANLWHALVLPRHTLGVDNRPHMDIPYANTAYGQRNADWPINQAVYVDYMIHGLRGYHDVATRELLSMFQTQQQPDGRMGGYGSWGVYSPGHLYAIAQNFLLSHDRESFERLLPHALKTLDWCLLEVAKAGIGSGSTGMIRAPLNDLTPSGHEWAFNQAYFVAGLQRFGDALALYGHERAPEVARVAARLEEDVERGFARASVRSPAVQLADGTWSSYVPTDAATPRRLLEEWYPTDVDTGPLHLPRLGALDAGGWLTTAMLHDHEDNLYLGNRGVANEPVYIPQATVYLRRDEPKAAIRSFYSMMASAFSHGQLTPLEHRWAHPIYTGPPSTDGAWFDVYRRMLVNEWKGDVLFIGQAIPRRWLSRGGRIEVLAAPTEFGPVSFTMGAGDSESTLSAEVHLSDRNPPPELRVRFRHPRATAMRAVRVNGEAWDDYDAEGEFVRVPHPEGSHYAIVVSYE